MTCTADLPAPALPGFDTHYGIAVRHIEDGDYVTALVACGHHDRRRALAAFNAYTRTRLGWNTLGGRLADKLAEAGDSLDLHQSWAVTVPTDDTPIYAQVHGAYRLNWPASPLDTGSFPVTVLAPEHTDPTEPDQPEETP